AWGLISVARNCQSGLILAKEMAMLPQPVPISSTQFCKIKITYYGKSKS
ncbi:34205_t:CDS:2, partial [Racocetra persica]